MHAAATCARLQIPDENCEPPNMRPWTSPLEETKLYDLEHWVCLYNGPDRKGQNLETEQEIDSHQREAGFADLNRRPNQL